MELNEAQIKTVAGWAQEGLSLAEIQKRINEEFNLSLTFMEVRFLLLDKDIKLKDRRAASAEAVDLSKDHLTEGAEPQEPGHGVPGKVSVQIDRLKKPGAIVNGTVTFSDGVSASWFIDQAGQLGINPSQPGYRPTENDLRSFQEELSGLLQSRGF